MKKIFLIKNPPLFQGEKNLNKSKHYFEGWYFKNTNKVDGISFIPGISIEGKEKYAFIQIITNNSSYFTKYDINDFKFSHNPFYIKIGDNFFSKDRIHIDIIDNAQNLKIYGDINYSNSENIKTSLISPNIMGPFSYIPFMECNHAIISMKSTTNGAIQLNNKTIKFENNTGYIEKDWGISFPKYYIWCQGNEFKKTDVSFMLSIADIPFKLFHFRGMICSLIMNNKEFKFTTYNGAKLKKYNIDNDTLNIELKKGVYKLNIEEKYDKRLKLSAPIKGKMGKDIFESISTTISITLKKRNKIIFSDCSTNCGLEIVKP